MNKQNSINELLVHLFNDILLIEENSLIGGKFDNLSMKEFHLIEQVGSKNDVIMSELAIKLRLTAGALTTAVDNLIKKGYVQRFRSQEDRRVVKVTLTALGKKAFSKHKKFHDDMVNTILYDLEPEESDTLIKSAESLINFFNRKNIYLEEKDGYNNNK